MQKCYLCREELTDNEESWYLTYAESVPMCQRCSKLLAKKFRSWVRSLRPLIRKKRKR